MAHHVDVILTPYEVAIGAHCGAMRHQAALRDNRPDAYGFDGLDGWTKHVEGACGEIAAAKAINRYWCPSVNTFGAADLDLTIQVRTRSRHDYDLIIRPEDNPDHCYVLVTGKAPRFTVRGYRIGHAARRDVWQQSHGGRPPAWFVPQADLWPISDLIHPPMRLQERA